MQRLDRRWPSESLKILIKTSLKLKESLAALKQEKNISTLRYLSCYVQCLIWFKIISISCLVFCELLWKKCSSEFQLANWQQLGVRQMLLKLAVVGRRAGQPQTPTETVREWAKAEQTQRPRRVGGKNTLRGRWRRRTRIKYWRIRQDITRGWVCHFSKCGSLR